jgi:hypothetical protein
VGREPYVGWSTVAIILLSHSWGCHDVSVVSPHVVVIAYDRSRWFLAQTLKMASSASSMEA